MTMVKRKSGEVAQETKPFDLNEQLDPSLYPVEEIVSNVPEKVVLPDIDPITPKNVSFSRNPTTKGLMGMSRGKKGVKIRVPVNSRTQRVRYQPIDLNGVVFEPGKTYELHPLLAQELKERIDAFEDAMLRQTTGGNMMDPGIQAEWEAQDAARRQYDKTASQFEI